ncbi:Hua1 protein [Saccharomycopsis crataegensis]|uniref:Hua1 protein n=1 Tax=Saccharomycopsis crataegensis TaxID=43959 RepID=A0AAV5QG16_9ASCO|nr:Hua1 protein [Saccharomycopsis crataegensis]
MGQKNSNSNTTSSNTTSSNTLSVNGHDIPIYENEHHEPSDLPPSYNEAIHTPLSQQEQLLESNQLPHRQPHPHRTHQHQSISTLNLGHASAQYGQSNNRYSSSASSLGSPYPGSFFPGSPPPQQNVTNAITPQTPWIYPLGFQCYKCRNTGIKLKNGLQCIDCWRQFAPSSSHVRRITTAAIDNKTGRPLFLNAGDPKLGGMVCGSCRGQGYIDSFLYYDTCFVCGGIGRVEFN